MHATPCITSSLCEDGLTVCFTQYCFGILTAVMSRAHTTSMKQKPVLTNLGDLTACIVMREAQT